MNGDLPVPPTLRFPTAIIGISKDLELKRPKSKALFLILMISPYKREIGNNIFRIKFTKTKYKNPYGLSNKKRNRPLQARNQSFQLVFLNTYCLKSI